MKTNIIRIASIISIIIAITSIHGYTEGRSQTTFDDNEHVTKDPKQLILSSRRNEVQNNIAGNKPTPIDISKINELVTNLRNTAAGLDSSVIKKIYFSLDSATGKLTYEAEDVFGSSKRILMLRHVKKVTATELKIGTASGTSSYVEISTGDENEKVILYQNPNGNNSWNNITNVLAQDWASAKTISEYIGSLASIYRESPATIESPSHRR